MSAPFVYVIYNDDHSPDVWFKLQRAKIELLELWRREKEACSTLLLPEMSFEHIALRLGLLT